MRKVKSLVLVLALLGAVGLAYFSYTNYSMSGKSSADDEKPKLVETIPKEDIVTDGVIAKNDNQPDGYGVKGEITGELKEYTKQALGDIDFSDEANSSIDIVGKLKEDKEVINTYIKKEDKQYTSIIDWTYGNITPDEYKSLVVVAGQIYEDSLNKESVGRYTVETNIPSSDSLEQLGVQVLFSADENNLLTLWTDLTIRDSKDKTEIKEIKSFTLYYEGNAIKVK